MKYFTNLYQNEQKNWRILCKKVSAVRIPLRNERQLVELIRNYKSEPLRHSEMILYHYCKL